MVYTYVKINQTIYSKRVRLIACKLNLNRVGFFLKKKEAQAHFQEENLTFAPGRSWVAEQEGEGVGLRGSVSESTSSPLFPA